MKCHQRIVRDKFQKEGFSDDLFISKPRDTSASNAYVKEVFYEEAKSIILKYEWLGTMPSQLYKAVGLYFDDVLSAVECFSSTKPGGTYTLFDKPSVCLSRGACAYWCPPFASSYLIPRALKFIDPKLFHYCIAYSDTDAGEIGTVYQACNWFCLGPVSRGNHYWIDPKGKRHDHQRHRSVARSRDPKFKHTKKLNPLVVEDVRQEMIRQGWREEKGGVRYRYASAIFENKREKKNRESDLRLYAKPYPKRKESTQ